MRPKSSLRPWELALMLSLVLALLTGLWAQAAQARLAGRFVRLHVIAASDSAADQTEKLAVRDAVLAVLTPKLGQAADRRDACRIILGAKREVLAAAREKSAHPVRLLLGTEHYPTREYGGFALPAGDYTSLRLVIGDGAGRNWWCVVFPPLCTSGALTPETVQAFAGEDAAYLTSTDGEYEIRFRVLELWDMVKQRLKESEE